MRKELRINEVVFSTELGEILILLNTESGKYLELNKTAKFIWKQLEEGLDEEAIIEKITDIYDLTHEEATSSFDTFTKDCLNKGLLKEEI